jgi:hypothetical protein
MEADLPQARSAVPCARMKGGVILTVSKPARMGIDDAPLYPPAAHGELLPVEHNLALIPTPDK